MSINREMNAMNRRLHCAPTLGSRIARRMVGWGAILMVVGLLPTMPLSGAETDDTAAGKEGMLIEMFLSFRWGSRIGAGALEMILAANGQPNVELGDINPEWHRAADSLGFKKGFNVPRLADFVLGKATAEELAAGLSDGYKRHQRGYAKRVKPLEGRKADVLLLDVEGQFGYRHNQANAAKSRKQTVAALSDVVKRVRQGGVRTFLYIGGDTRTDGAWLPRGGRKGPRVRRTSEHDAADLALMDQAVGAARELGIDVIPAYRAFAVLRRRHPEFPLEDHLAASVHGQHPLNYLNACTIAATLLGRRPDVPDKDAQEPFRRLVAKSNKGYAREFTKRGIEPPPELTQAQLEQLHDAAWAAVQEVRAMAASPAKGDQ